MAKMTVDTINTTLIQDNQPVGSITPSDMRTIVSSLAGFPSKTVSEAAYTIILTDDGVRVRMSSAATARNFTVPPHSSVALDNDSIIAVFMALAGVITVVAGAGVTIRQAPSLTSLVMVQYQTIILQQDFQDTWIAT